jgi:hypothetical protein
MCEPTTLVALTGMSAGAASTTALAIQGVSAVTSAASAIDQSNKQNEAVARNAQSAKDAYFLKSKQTNLRVLQEQTQAAQQKRDADLKALKSQGTAAAAAAGAGVQGVDVDRLLNDFERSEGVLADRIEQRLEGMQQQAEMNKLGFQSEAQNRINSMQPIGFAETLFNVVEPIAGFAVNYADTKARYADLEN